ncbi:hypothetical protein EJD97_006468 [Solanum chilense]|uniref:Uncharacterized protein n=1 Tax=Solanum chilense TaxID=4083 RepID=A0A6N2CAD2_SOLCI|nr:hypothetical protein EJD97_006468 [Solanum chilense]
MKSANMSMVFGAVEIPDMSQIPLTTIRDEVRVTKIFDHESYVETDEEMHDVTKDAAYDCLIETEEIMVDVVVEASRTGTPFVVPS